MRGGKPDRQVDPQVQAARITASRTVVAAVVTAVLGVVGAVVVATIERGPAAPPPKVINVAAGCATPTLRLTSPRPDQAVRSATGVRVTGSACGLRGDSGWLFDSDSVDPYYYEVYPDDPGPAVDRNGNWATVDKPIGDSTDQAKPYVLTLVLASPPCADALRAMQPTDGDLKTLAFPAGCRVAGHVQLLVTG